jgi:hypothetical protein
MTQNYSIRKTTNLTRGKKMKLTQLDRMLKTQKRTLKNLEDMEINDGGRTVELTKQIIAVLEAQRKNITTPLLLNGMPSTPFPASASAIAPSGSKATTTEERIADAQLVEIRPATQQKIINKIAQLTEWGCIVSSVISGPTTTLSISIHTSKERKLSKSEQELQSKVCEYPLD